MTTNLLRFAYHGILKEVLTSQWILWLYTRFGFSFQCDATLPRVIFLHLATFHHYGYNYFFRFSYQLVLIIWYIENHVNWIRFYYPNTFKNSSTSIDDFGVHRSLNKSFPFEQVASKNELTFLLLPKQVVPSDSCPKYL